MATERARLDVTYPAESTTSAGVLLVANFPRGSGYAWQFIADLWRRFAALADKAGFSATLVYPEGNADPDAPDGLPSATLSVPDGIGWELWKAVRMIRRLGVRILYFTDRKYSSVAYLVYRAFGVKAIVVHDHSPGDRAPLSGMRASLVRSLRRLPGITVDYVFTVSPLIRSRAIEASGMPESRVRTVQNGLPDHIANDLRLAIRAELGLPSDAVLCVSVCRAHRYKRVEHLIEVAAAWDERSGDETLHFVHCGDGPDLPRLIQLCNLHKVAHRVHFLGFRQDTADIVAAADLAFHPSAGEAFSLAIIEYMRAGLPVVVPSLPTVSQAIEHEVTGLIYREGDVRHASECIASLWRNGELRHTMGQAARASYLKSFTIGHTYALFDSSVAEVLALATRT